MYSKEGDNVEVFDTITSKFVIVPRTLVEDKQVTYRDKSVFMVLCLYANNITKEAHPSTETIADKVGCCRRSVFESIARLEEFGYIKRKTRRGKNKRNLTNAYYILDK